MPPLCVLRQSHYLHPAQAGAALALLAVLTGQEETAWAARGATAKPAAPAPAPYRLTLPAGAPYRATLPPTVVAHAPGGNTPRRPDVALTALAAQPAIAHRPYAREIAAAAREHGVDPALIHAVVAVESNYRPDALSPKGARGLMQLMPDTARRYGSARDQCRPADNLRAGTRYLRDLLDQFPARLDLALAAYNAGENAVRRYGNHIPPYAETRQYVPAVMTRFTAWHRTPWQIDASADSSAWHLNPHALTAAWQQHPTEAASPAPPAAMPQGPLAAASAVAEASYGDDHPDHSADWEPR